MSGQAVTRSANGATLPAQDPVALGQVLAASGYFDDARQAAQAAVKVMAGAELGFPPIASMTGIYIVKGRVTLSAQLMAATIKRSGRYDYRVVEHTTECCRIEFTEGGETIYTSEYTMADAKAAGLAGSDTWKKHPRNMLFARALSNGAKWATPDVFGGPIYTPDELGAEVDGESGDVLSLPENDRAPVEAASVVIPPRITQDAAAELQGLARAAIDSGAVDGQRFKLQLVDLGALTTANLHDGIASLPVDAEQSLRELLTAATTPDVEPEPEREPEPEVTA